MAMATFEARNGKLFIDGKEVLRGWEAWTGWYWFATEIARTQDSIINGPKPIWSMRRPAIYNEIPNVGRLSLVLTTLCITPVGRWCMRHPLLREELFPEQDVLRIHLRSGKRRERMLGEDGKDSRTSPTNNKDR